MTPRLVSTGYTSRHASRPRTFWNSCRTTTADVLASVLCAKNVVGFNSPKPHLAPGFAEEMERVGTRVLRLPSYSPDLMPIEQMFSKFKGVLRRAGARARHLLGWFEHADLRAIQT